MRHSVAISWGTGRHSVPGRSLCRYLLYIYVLWTSTYHRISAGAHHDDVIKCKNFRRYWPFVRGIHRSSVNSPHKSQWRGALMFSLIDSWINNWVNNGEACDLRRHPAHYYVTVKFIPCKIWLYYLQVLLIHQHHNYGMNQHPWWEFCRIDLPGILFGLIDQNINVTCQEISNVINCLTKINNAVVIDIL